jgi:tripartite-type tricarboxylate transporter receptor subunit TctC
MPTLMKIFTGLLMLALGAGAAFAQEQYPHRTIKIVVPTSPGFTTDVLARSIGQALSQSWNETVIVENRPGGNETLGTDAVAKSAPDGYTLLLTSNGAITAAPHLFKHVRYDPQKDLTPIFMLGWVTPVMIVPAASPVKSVQDLIALAKSKPGELNYGSFGTGSYSHVAMEDFQQRTGTKMMHLPHKGAAPAYTALLRGEFAVMLANLAGAAVHADAGKVRIIAAAGPRRSEARPDLPTIAESGVPGFSTGAWWGLFGPANLPQPILDKIRTEVARVLDSPDIKKLYKTNTMELVKMTPEQFKTFIADDLEHWGRQIKTAGIQPN